MRYLNRDNVRAPIQFRRERQPQHLKRCFFLKNRPIHFHVNSTSVTRPVKQNQLNFPSIEINKTLLASVHSVFSTADTIQDGCLIFKQLGKKKRNHNCVLIIKTSHHYLLKI